MYIVDKSLRAIPLLQLHNPALLELAHPQTARPGHPDAPPRHPALPVSPDGRLVAGQLYPSSTEPEVRYYLPRYALHLVAGQYQASLHWTANAAAPGDPIGMLTVDLAALTPEAGGFTLREIEHTAVARLRYTRPVEAADQGLPSFAYELGALNPVAPGLRRCRLPIYARADFDRIYRIMTEERYGGILEVRAFATIGYRTWRQVVAPRLDHALVRRPARNLGVERGLPGGAGPADDELFALQPTRLSGAARRELFGRPAEPLGGGPISALNPRAAAEAAAPMRVLKPEIAARVAQPARGRNPVGATLRPVDTAVLLPNDPQKSQPLATPIAELLRHSDLRVGNGAGTKSAIPVGALVDKTGRPALLTIPVETTQTVGQFWFLPATSAPMFQLPGGFAPEARDTLLPGMFAHADGRVVRYYRDAATGRCYYQPTEFLLARTARPSIATGYQPALLAAMQAIITTGEGQGDAVTDTRVSLSYRLLPSLDADLLDLTLDHLERESGTVASLLPLDPVTAEVSFDSIPDLPAQELRVDFVSGIAGELDLSETQFKQLMALLTARPDQPSATLSGSVNARLSDNTSVTVPLRISLKETAGPLFDVAILGPAPGSPDEWHVALTNRVESPVAITGLRQVAVGAAARAYPQPFAATTLQPGQAATATYRIVPANGPLRAIEPQVNAGVQIVDYKLLWRRLVVQQGFTDERFNIGVTIAGPEYFADSPDGVNRLTAVAVEFDCGVTTRLTPESQRTTVELERGYLAALIGDFSTYRYTFTCSFSNGFTTTSDWLASDLNPLVLVPILPPG